MWKWPCESSIASFIVILNVRSISIQYSRIDKSNDDWWRTSPKRIIIQHSLIFIEIDWMYSSLHTHWLCKCNGVTPLQFAEVEITYILLEINSIVMFIEYFNTLLMLVYFSCIQISFIRIETKLKLTIQKHSLRDNVYLWVYLLLMRASFTTDLISNIEMDAFNFCCSSGKSGQ